MKRYKLFCFIIILVLFTNIGYSDNYRLKGTVLDQGDKPLLGVLISLLPVNTPSAEKLVAVTDINGEYSFENLSRGKYKVAATTLDGAAFEEKSIKIAKDFQYRRDFVLNLMGSKSVNKKSIDTEWVLRSDKRDILRQETGNMASKSIASFTEHHTESISGFGGQFELEQEHFLGKDSISTKNTSFNLKGAITDSSDWDLSAEMKNRDNFKPTFSAIGRYRNKIHESFDLELGVGFKEFGNIHSSSHAAFQLDQEKPWRGSLYTKNSWQVWEPLQLNCTLKFDHYNYIDQENYLSPQVEIVYEPAKWAKMKGSVGVETIHPDDKILDFENIPVFFDGELKEERATKYQITFEGGLGGGYLISLQAFYSNINNKHVTVIPSGDNSGRYLYNVGDSVVKGLSFDFKKQVGDWFRGSISYSLSKAVVLDTENLALVFDNMNQIELLLGEEIAHELTTRLEAEIDTTETTVSAVYRVVIGSLGPEEIAQGFVDTKRLDIQLIQKLPFLAFTGTRWEIHLNVRNLFDSHGLNYFINSEEIFGAQRKISGGVSIYF